MGGNAIEGVGKIHKSELSLTLYELKHKLNWPYSAITDNLLGSVGKKEYSGDIDIAVEYKGEEGVADFLFGNVELMKVYSYSPSEEESDYTGTQRNLGIISICRYLDRHETNEHDGFGRPIECTRWKWSPTDGLLKVKRISKRHKTHPTRWVTKQKDIPLCQPIIDKATIIGKLFKGTGQSDQIDSLEKIVLGVRKCYSAADQEKIFRTMAEECMAHRRIGKLQWSYPPEIDKYYSPPTK